MTSKDITLILAAVSAIVLSITFALPHPSSTVFAYNNSHAHVDINKYSLIKFNYDILHDYSKKYAKYRKYDFKQGIIKFQGIMTKAVGKFNFKDETETGNYQFWLSIGGYTADVPEFDSSLRHFYDPLKIQTDRATGKKVNYLTDHTLPLILDTVGKALKTDPRMDAREWALTGPARRGYDENRFSLKKGIEYMRLAWAEKDLKLKNKYFAAAWRACGETMHLLSDMTVPAHVRNDAHPFGTIFSGLRYDPYEHYTTSNNANYGNIIKKFYDGKVDSRIARKIENCKSAASLFHEVALFTNQNFFSADTLTGRNENGEIVRSANGMRDYPSPTLNKCRVDSLRVYNDKTTGFSVAHADWAKNSWWNVKNYLKQSYSKKISASSRAIDSYEDVAMDQAKVLLPVAVAANEKLLEMFIPEIKVELSGFDPENRAFTGTIKHKLSGVYADPTLNPKKKPLSFSNIPDSWSRLTINNRPYSPVSKEYAIYMEDNVFAIAIDDSIKLKSNSDNVISLEVFFGGFWVKSNEFVLKSKSNKTTAKTLKMSGSGLLEVFANDRKNYKGNLSFEVKVTVESDNAKSIKLEESKVNKCNAQAQVVTNSKTKVSIQVTGASISGAVKIAGYEIQLHKNKKWLSSKSGNFTYEVGTNEEDGGAELWVNALVKGVEYKVPMGLLCDLNLASFEKKPYWFDPIK